MTPGQSTMDGRVCLVTGTNGGMGKVVVTNLARRGATVVLVCRDRGKGEAAQRIVEATGNSSVDLLVAVLSDQSEIRHLAEEFRGRYSELHVLVNNAGAHIQQRRLSVDGIEVNLAINHLASFLLTNLLVDTLKASASSRVVNVASAAMKNSLDLDALQWERRFQSKLQPMRVYGEAKLASVMCGYILARRLEGTGVTVNALHPGITATTIIDDIAPRWFRPFIGIVKLLLQTPEQGARTTTYLATASEVAAITDKYFIKQRERQSPLISYDTDVQQQI